MPFSKVIFLLTISRLHQIVISTKSSKFRKFPGQKIDKNIYHQIDRYWT